MTYNNTPKTERNLGIVADFLAGASYSVLAAKHGLHPSRIYAIIKASGNTLSYEQCCARKARFAKIRAGNERIMERQRASIKARRDAGLPWGRRPIFAEDQEKREQYIALREAMGAAYAREQMGLAR